MKRRDLIRAGFLAAAAPKLPATPLPIERPHQDQIQSGEADLVVRPLRQEYFEELAERISRIDSRASTMAMTNTSSAKYSQRDFTESMFIVLPSCVGSGSSNTDFTQARRGIFCAATTRGTNSAIEHFAEKSP